MEGYQFCRLCLSTSNDDYMNIFSVIGIEMKMGEIISEHFKCEVSQHDLLPKFVCQVCWQTTESFHDLYQKSKKVQETFLNPTIKFEPDVSEPWQSNLETHFIEESDLDFMPIKPETILEESDSNINYQMNYDDNTNDSDAESNGEKDDKSDEENANKIDKNENPSSELLPAQKKSRKIIKEEKADRDKQFNEFLAEHKNLLKMNCESCPIIFKTLHEARTHYAKIHKNPNGYIQCCNSKLYYPHHVIAHIKKHLEPASKPRNPLPKIATCDICSKSFSSEKTLKIHMKLHEAKIEIEDENYTRFMAENFDMKCDRCDTVFSGLYEARYHYKKHNEDRGYIKCCNVKLRQHSTVRDHIRSHLDPECFKCTTCEKSFTTKDKLNKHKHRHRLTMNKSFICDYCKKGCRDKEQLLRHMYSKHKIVEAKYACEICHKKFQLPLLLRTHMYAAHREKKTIGTCEICGKSFYTNFHLEKHKLQHIDKSERLFERKQCEHCGEWLMTKSGVFYHKQIHTSGPQKCPHCQLECTSRPALLGHIRKYHREHKFKCSLCDKTFPIKSALKAHEQSIHTRNRVFSCQFCDKTFTVRNSLRTHMGRNHPEERIRLREMRKLHGAPTENIDIK